MMDSIRHEFREHPRAAGISERGLIHAVVTIAASFVWTRK